MAEIVKSADFQALIQNSEKPVMVDFYADWCGPCKMIAPFIEQLAEEMKDAVKIVKIDTDAAWKAGESDPVVQFMQANGIRGIPALVLFKDGQPDSMLMGGRPKAQIQAWLESRLPAAAPAPAGGTPPAPAP